MQQLNPKSIWLFFLTFLSRILPILIFFAAGMGMFFFSDERATVLDASILFALLPVVLPVIGLIAWVWSKYTYHFYGYEVREDGFRKEHGIIWKRYVTIPYDRIQNVDIYRGLIARLLGLSDLQIQTAGGLTSSSYGAFSEGRLPGLSREVAEQLRDELIKRARSSRSQGL